MCSKKNLILGFFFQTFYYMALILVCNKDSWHEKKLVSTKQEIPNFENTTSNLDFKICNISFILCFLFPIYIVINHRIHRWYHFHFMNFKKIQVELSWTLLPHQILCKDRSSLYPLVHQTYFSNFLMIVSIYFYLLTNT